MTNIPGANSFAVAVGSDREPAVFVYRKNKNCYVARYYRTDSGAWTKDSVYRKIAYSGMSGCASS
jgi:uncharacterized protein (UPF0333 family)